MVYDVVVGVAGRVVNGFVVAEEEGDGYKSIQWEYKDEGCYALF